MWRADALTRWRMPCNNGASRERVTTSASQMSWGGFLRIKPAIMNPPPPAAGRKRQTARQTIRPSRTGARHIIKRRLSLKNIARVKPKLPSKPPKDWCTTCPFSSPDRFITQIVRKILINSPRRLSRKRSCALWKSVLRAFFQRVLSDVYNSRRTKRHCARGLFFLILTYGLLNGERPRTFSILNNHNLKFCLA